MSTMTRSHAWFGGIAGLILFAAVLGSATGAHARGQIKSYVTNDRCAALIARAEHRYGIPRRILESISLAESGRYDKPSRALIAWPWTVNNGGRGKYYASKAQAVAAVRQLIAQGRRNIDVGCMQVNLMHHPKAFSNLEAAMDPARNVDYAARYLKSLHERSKSWVTAIAHYHSKNREFGHGYMLRVLRIWVSGRNPRHYLRVARNLRPSGKRRLATATRRRLPRVVRGDTNVKVVRGGIPLRYLRGQRLARIAPGAKRGSNASPSLVRRLKPLQQAQGTIKRSKGVTVVRGQAARRRWEEIVQRRRKFADWLAKRQADRRAGRDPS